MVVVFGAGSVWLAVGVISCKDYGLKRERVRGRKNVRGEKKILK